MKLIAMLAVVLLAGLGILMVLDIVPRELFQPLVLRGLMVVVIVFAASLVVGLLMKSGNSEKP
ncbi:MAG: hypothetical protein ACRETM_03385 [Stenotrophobium sp.]